MHAQEVDNAHLNSFVVHLDFAWGTRYEAEQLVRAGGPDADMPVLLVAWNQQAPPQQADRIVESEQALGVFDIVLSQKCEHLMRLAIVSEVQGHKFKSSRQSYGLLLDFIDSFAPIYGAILFCMLLEEPPHRLSIPEVVFFCQLHVILEVLLLQVTYPWVFQLLLRHLHPLQLPDLLDFFLGGFFVLHRSPAAALSSCWDVACFVRVHYY